MKKLILGSLFVLGLLIPFNKAHGQQVIFEIPEASLTETVSVGGANAISKIAVGYSLQFGVDTICSIQIHVGKSNNPGDSLVLSVYNDTQSPHLPEQGDLLEQVFKPANQISNNPSYINFNLSSCIESGTRIWFVVSRSNPLGGGEYIFSKANQNYPVFSWEYSSNTQWTSNGIIGGFEDQRDWGIRIMGPTPISTRNPVLIIPGIAGTELNNGNDNIWLNLRRIFDLSTPNDYFLTDNLLLDTHGNSILDITHNSVIESVDDEIITGLPIINTFLSLREDLENAGFILDQNLFYFPYDWRLDLSSSAASLSSKIEEVKNLTHSDKIDVIAHSMGGLVLKEYLNNFGNENLEKIFFVGTPHLGAPKAGKVLLEGDRLGIPWLEEDRIRDVALNSPAVYQLLPTQTYFNNMGSYVYSRGLLASAPLDYEGTKEFFGDENLNQSLIQRAEDFHTQELDNPDFSGLEVYNFAGCREATQSAYRFSSGNLFINRVAYSSGDETVPLVSADYINTPNKFYVRNGNHSELPSNEAVRNAITAILDGQTPTLGADLNNSISFCNFRGKQLEWHSPVDVHVYDSQNRHSGPIEGGVENNIPGVDYEIIDGHKFIFLPTDEGQQYRVEGIGTNTGSFDLVITENDNGTEGQSIFFNDVPLLVGSRVNFDVSENIVNNQINFDYDNNGTFEVVNPSLPEFDISFNTSQKDFVITSDENSLSCITSQCSATDEFGNNSVLKFNKFKLGGVYTLSFKSATYNGETKDLSDNVFIVTLGMKNNQVIGFTQTLLVKKQEVASIIYDYKTGKSTILTYKNGKLVKETVQGLRYLQVNIDKGVIKVN